jgi:RNA-directed DNA polymerase
MVAGRASPDDPALARYWADRRRRRPPPQTAESWQRALRARKGRCPHCGGRLLDPDRYPDSPGQGEAWYAHVRTALTLQASAAPGGGRTRHRLVHTPCARRHPGGPNGGTDTSTRRACPPTRAA